MLETGKLTSYLGGKYILSNIKKELIDVTQKSQVLKYFNKESLGKDKYHKIYYDTPDYLFHQVGINICQTLVKGNKTSEIVVRYDSEKKRISFLQYMPDTYTLTVPAKDSIMRYTNFVADAITELITNGLQTDMHELVRTIKPIMVVDKKRERFHFSKSTGLKMLISFDNVVYTSPITHEKEKMDIMEIICKSGKNTAQEYLSTVKALIIENPTIVETRHSDIFIGLDYVLNMK